MGRPCNLLLSKNRNTHIYFQGVNMKRITLLIVLLVMSMTFLTAQNIGEYTYATSITGSLADMSTGTTPLLTVGTYWDDSASPVTNMGFNFKFAGAWYTQFSANSNGQMQLGSTAIAGGSSSPASGIARLAPLSGDNAIRSTGKLHYKVTGSSPNQILVVEWLDLRVPFSSSVETGTYCRMQALLYEGTNKIEYIYGTMYNMGTSTAARGVYISNSNVAGTVGNIVTIITTPTWTITGTSVVTTTFPLNSAMANLNSAADGSRRVFSFTPPAATAFPNAAVAVAPPDGGWAFIGSTLSWNNGSTSGGAYVDSYDVYFGVSASPAFIQNQLLRTYTPTLAAGTTYYWKVVPKNSMGDCTTAPTWSFKTPTTNQLAESFESTTFPPTGWTNPGAFTRSTVTPYHLTAGAYKSTATAAMLYTPMMSLDANSELYFMARAAATTGIGRIQVKYSADASEWTPIGEEIAMPANSNWNNYIVDLGSLSGNYFIGFETYSSTSTAAGIYIDYVFGPEFAALTPDPATAVYPVDGAYAFTDAILTWTAASTGGIPNSYDVYLGTTVSPAFVQNQSTLSYTPTLAANTTYYWQIVPRNDTGGAEDCPVWSFSTPAANQLAESFDDTAFPPVGWANPGTWSRSTTTPFYGTATAYKSASTTPAILSTPILAIGASSVLDFYYRTASTTGYGLMNIKYSTDRVNWNQIGATISMPTTTTWNNAVVNLAAIPAGNYYLGFEVSTSTSTSSIYIDHVMGPLLANVAPGPVSLTAPADVATGVSQFPTFTWTAPVLGGIPTGYKVYCDTNSNPTTLIGTVTGLTYTATSPLAFSTLYYWKVVAYNDNGDSTDNTTRSFTSSEDPTISVFPFVDGFELNNTHGSTSVYLWNQALDGGLTKYWTINSTNTTYNRTPRTGLFNVTLAYSGNAWLFRPMTLTGGVSYDVELYARQDNVNTSLADLGIYYGNDQSIVSMTNTIVAQTGLTNGDYQRFFGSFTPDTSGTYYIGIHGTMPTTTPWYISMDDIMIRQTPSGIPDHVTLSSPVDGASGLDPDNVVLTWNAALAGGTPDYYEVYVGEFPIDPGTEYYGEYSYETTGTSLVLSDQDDISLPLGSTWYWAVLPYNGNPPQNPDLDSPEFMTWDFTIAPDPTITSLPYAEYFDGVTAPALPWGWSAYINSTNAGAVVATINSTTYAQSAPNSVRLYNPSDAAADLRLFTPPIAVPLNTIKLKFYARSSTAGYPLLVGTVNTTDGTGVFNQLQSIALTATKTEYIISLDGYAGSDTYICFKHGLGGTGRTLYVDDVQLIQLLANDLAATSLTGPSYLEAGQTYDYTVAVYNEGTAQQSSYNVYLKSGANTLATLNVSTPLAAGATAQHILAWTPSVGGTFEIFGQVGLGSDQYADNNNTAIKTVYVVDNTMEVIPIGDDATTTSGYYLPLDMYHKNSVTEQLYFADEMHLSSGNITAVVYKNTFATNLTDKPIKIWMAHTTVTDLTGGWLPAGNYTLVFDGVVDFPSGINYIVIPLDTPYTFTGGTLATRVNRPIDTVYYSTSDKFYYTTNPAHTNRGRYLVSDTVTYSPLAPEAAGTAVAYVANTMFVVENAVMQTGAKMEGYVYQQGGTTPIAGATVTLTDERYSTTTDINGFYQFNFWEAHTVTATASKAAFYPQTVTGVSLSLGNTVTQNFSLTAMPRVTVSGVVTANDFPSGLEGAEISLSGTENYSVLSGVGGAYSIPNVLGSVDGIAYTVTIAKEGYESYLGNTTTYSAAVNLGTTNLVEYLWTPYNLVASHAGNNVSLVWEPAAAPDYYFFDFEEDNGGWVASSNWSNPLGDWEWTNTYNVANWAPTYTGTTVVPPSLAFSGTGLWGTKINTNYSNSGGFNYLTQTFDLTGFVAPKLSFRSWENTFGNFDYCQVRVNGTLIWGPSWDYSATMWRERIIDLSAYTGMTNVTVQFEMFATTSVNYAGWYIDDIYIGPATRHIAQLGSRNADRSLQNYSVYRMLAADEANVANWTTLQSATTNTTYTDTGFAAVPGGIYKWAVKANYSAGLASDPILSNSLGRVYTPQDIAVTNVGTSVVLNWTAEPGASFYRVYASDDPYGTFTYLGFSLSNSYTVSAPTPAKKFYKVKAGADETPARDNPEISK